MAAVAILAVFGAFASPVAKAESAIVGVNLANPHHLNPGQQDELIKDLKAAGVRYIRMPLADDNAIDLARRAFAAGIKTNFIVPLQFRPGTAPRPAMGGQFAAHKLSDADPGEFRTTFAHQLQQIEQGGVTLAGLELGNEINLTGFNGDFPFPGRGRVFSAEDLGADPEAVKVAAGYRAYVATLAVLREIRDGSKLNKKTPIVSAGLSDPGLPGPRPGSKVDAVSIGATIAYLRAKGLDKFVDFYGVHAYPNPKAPEEARAAKLRADTFADCGTGGRDKACWVTEWGIPSESNDCGADDGDWGGLIRATKSQFGGFVREGRVTALFYFAWEPDPWEKQLSNKWSIYRCGKLTNGGKFALSLE